MYLTDFIFDGVKLSSLGYLVGAAVSSNNDSSSAGSKLELQTVVNHGNHLTGIVNATYNENVSATFDIIKYACNEQASVNMEDNEIALLMRWLNRTTWCKFKPIYNDMSFPNLFFMGTFTEISTINMGGCVVGLSLTFTANAPWGFLDFNYTDATHPIVINSANDSFTFYDESDELGNHYPEKITITTLNAGNLKLRNLLNNRITVINNCQAGETIELDCINKIITASGSAKALVPTLSAMNSDIIYDTIGGTVNNLWKVFDGNLTTSGGFSGNNVNGTGTQDAYIGYHFSNPVSISYATMCWGNINRDTYSFTVKIQGSNDCENWDDLSLPTRIPNTTQPISIASISNEKYSYIIIRYISYVCPTNIGYPQAHEIQFYGNYDSSVEHPHLYNDFNYVYPMFTNTQTDNKNVISSSLPCSIQIDYKPIRKVGIIA